VMPAVKDMVAFWKANVLPIYKILFDIIRNDLLPVFRTFAAFIMDVIVPAIKNMAGPALKGLLDGLEKVRSKIRENKNQFDTFFESLRPIFEYIRDVAAPIIGMILGQAFRGLGIIIGGVIDALVIVSKVLAKAIDKIRAFMAVVAESALGRGIGNIVDAVTGRQFGGLVTPNRPFLVGERGPEMFVPMGAGRIMPEIPMMIPSFEAPEGSGGGTTYIINVSGAIDAEGTARTILRTLRDAERRTGERLAV